MVNSHLNVYAANIAVSQGCHKGIGLHKVHTCDSHLLNGSNHDHLQDRRRKVIKV